MLSGIPCKEAEIQHTIALKALQYRSIQRRIGYKKQRFVVPKMAGESAMGTINRSLGVTSTRFADRLKTIQQSELVIFEGCAHAPIYEKVDEFNQTTLEFLKRHPG